MVRRPSTAEPILDTPSSAAPRVGIALCDCLAEDEGPFPLSLLQLALQTSLNAPLRSFRQGCSEAGELTRWVADRQVSRILLVCAAVPTDERDSRHSLAALREIVDQALAEVEVFTVRLPFRDAPEARTETKVRRAVHQLTAAYRYLERRPNVSAGQRGRRPGGLVPSRVTRRQLFRRATEEPCVIPEVRHSRCAAVSGCRLCTSVCPTAALEVVNHRLQVDHDLCEGCGLCANACPRRALEQPDYDRAALATQLRVLADPRAAGPAPLLLACPAVSQRLEEAAAAGLALPAPLQQIALPCLRLLPAEWVLRALDAGASRVLVSTCDQRCRWYQPTPMPRHGLRLAWAVLGHVGGDESLVTEVDLLGEAPDANVQRLHEHCAGGSNAEALDRQALGAIVTRLAHRGCLSPEALPGGPTESSSLFSHVRVDADQCTVCGACVGACPASALTLRETDEPARRLQFNATRCVGCDYCRAACPERAIALGANGDVHAFLSAQPATAAHSPLVCCRQCQRPFATLTSQQRLRQLLAAEGGNPLALDRLDTCPDCCARSLALEAVSA